MTLEARTLWRWIACGAVIAVTCVWVAAGAGPLLGECLAERARADSGAALRLRWADAAARSAARRIVSQGGLGREALAASLLASSARARPLYAPTWLERARVALLRGRTDRAAAHAKVAESLWPNRARLLWRVAAFRTELGEVEGALRALRAYLRAALTDVAPVAWIATRLEPDPTRLVEALFDAGDLGGAHADSHLTQLLYFAVGRGDAILATRAWAALSPVARAERRTAGRYVDALVGAGRIEDAIAIWGRTGAAGGIGAGITNRGFETDAALSGLGWRVRPALGATWARDARVRHAGEYSLRIAFDGSANLTYQHVSQLVPVAPGQAYRLSGYWRGAGITTRSGPYLEVASRNGGGSLRVRSPHQTGTWEWSRFELDFRAPQDARLVEFRVRRDPADGWKARIAGSLWLDDLELEPLPASSRRG